MYRIRSAVLSCAVASLIAGCAPAPVTWADAGERVRVPAAEADAALAQRLAAHLPRGTRADAPAPDSLHRHAIGDDRPCVGTLRAAGAAPHGSALAWWGTTADGRGRLHLRSADAQSTWRDRVSVDTVLSRDSLGCARPAIGLAIDARSGWIHVAYGMAAPEGPGVFYAHQMDPRALFEPPRVIVYGEGRAAASVASDGDLVAVAFENPNDRPTIGLALSRTGGHLFDPPVRASTSAVPAERPRVAVRGDSVIVGWIETVPRSTSVTLVVRRGRVR
ncbi:MAG: hypothetical protein MUE41_10025 [Gemmatimonadaceae bacterium]|nr:hypothetical protein [Gemmatimonadaceae bacterium]